ncbi:LysR substrate-binding domain-containing protein [Nesterenkonia sp. LB17]|uniref:LysR substrate-binding domain-containing protein n=1 Tax=Nesterenkonia sp. LB17 TaxID=2901230 RepID=UPI001F4CD4C4|nr:LysR substrate-binding domain-containing protein [Nesterenkonia sp. LB17]MCH8566068.1 LysR substrate-binding domain-containing protein [Nesterenkonia sp. LB17]
MRLGAIPGATPDKWVTRWRERYPDFALSVDRFDEAGQLERLRAGTVDVGYIRFPEDAQAPTGDDLHRVWLYREAPVVCASRDHWVAAAETSVTWDEIAAEPFFDPAEMLPEPGSDTSAPDPSTSEQSAPESEEPEEHQPADPEQLAADDIHTPKLGVDLAAGERMALEVVASGAGLVILPNSVARMLARRDIVIREVEGLPGYDVGLAWLREADGPVIQEFIGVARGRKPGSGRSEISTGVEAKSGSNSGSKPEAKSDPRSKSTPKRAAARAAPGRSRPGPKPGSRRGQPPRGRRRPR